MPSFEQDHPFLLELAKLRETTKSYKLDYTVASIDEVLAYEDTSNKDEEGPTPTGQWTKEEHENWYTQYWLNCAQNHICADLDG